MPSIPLSDSSSATGAPGAVRYKKNISLSQRLAAEDFFRAIATSKPMTPANTLPDGPTMPVILRLIKFITQPIQYLDDFCQIYCDTFTVWGRNDTPIVYFSQPQALQQIFSADTSKLDAGRGNQGLKFLLGDNSLLLLDGDRHQRV